MIYCKQIPPEYQESRLFDDEGMGPDYISVTGNRDYISRTSPLFDRVYNALNNGELAEALDDIKNGGYYSSFYKNATEAINDILEPDKPKYSTRDIHALKELVRAYTEAASREENNILCKVLSIVTGRKWDWKIIRGYCQSDWNEVFYPVDDWSREALSAFETMYFNTGSEWIIHDEENTPEGPEDISGYSCYIVADTEEGIRKELAAVAGCAPSDLVIWAFDEFIRVAQYKAV
jgi:hypothetical protein